MVGQLRPIGRPGRSKEIPGIDIDGQRELAQVGAGGIDDEEPWTRRPAAEQQLIAVGRSPGRRFMVRALREMAAWNELRGSDPRRSRRANVFGRSPDFSRVIDRLRLCFRCGAALVREY